MELFKGQNIVEFGSRFNSDKKCLEYLSQHKWSSGYQCRKCGHQKSQILSNYSRTCNLCSYTESPIINTFFHRVVLVYKKHFLYVLRCQIQPKVFQQVKWLYRLVLVKNSQNFYKQSKRINENK